MLLQDSAPKRLFAGTDAGLDKLGEGSTMQNMRGRLRRVFRGKSSAMVVVLIAATTGGIVVLNASASSSGAGGEVPKSQLPANVNPDKQPVLDPGKITSEPSVALTPQQEQEQATAWAAQEPNSRVVCFASDGSVAGVAALDRVDPTKPPTAEESAATCSQGFPGSRP